MKQFIKPRFALAAALVLMLGITSLTGCNSNDDTDVLPTETASETPEAEETETPTEQDSTVYGKASDYFPFDSNLTYVHKRNDEFGQSITYNVYQEDNRLQRLNMTGNIRGTEVIEKTEDSVIAVFTHSESSGLEYFLDKTANLDIVLLKDPIQLGNFWDTSSGNSFSGVAAGRSEITGVNVEIEVPAGKFTTIEVSTVMENGYTTVDYYAEDIGLVREDYFIKGVSEGNVTSDDAEVGLELESFEKDSSLAMNINVYYPNEEGSSLTTEPRSIDFNTNDDVVLAFENLLKNPSETNETALIPEDAEILNLSIDREEMVQELADRTLRAEIATVNLDLSKEPLAVENAESAYEKLLVLGSIRQIFAEFYLADDFILTVNGEPYTITADVSVYYPNESASALESSVHNVEFAPNFNILTIFDSLFKNPANNPELRLIPEHAYLISLSVENDGVSTVTLDLSQEFVLESNTGLAYEELILEAMKQTLTEFYNAEEFELTVEGEPYIPEH